jgi:3D (Asp-Asp-Asp) domain-containing protein
MANLIFGKSAFIAGALISTSLIFFTNSSVVKAPAAPLQEPQHQTKQVLQDQATVKEESISNDTSPSISIKEETPTLESKTTEEATEPTSLERPRTVSTSKQTEGTLTSPTLPSSESVPTEPMQTFVATAYSLRGKTASGKYTCKGLIAADLRVLPIGTRVRVEAGNYSGEYLVADSGGAVRGKKIDIWVPSTREAMRFGRRTVKLTVLSYGKRRKK